MTQHDESNSERIEAALQQLRDELADVESVRGEVAARIAETSVGPGVRWGARGALVVVASFIVIALATVMLLNRHYRPSPIPVVVRDPAGLPAVAAEPFKLDVGD